MLVSEAETSLTGLCGCDKTLAFHSRWRALIDRRSTRFRYTTQIVLFCCHSSAPAPLRLQCVWKGDGWTDFTGVDRVKDHGFLVRRREVLEREAEMIR